MTCGNYYAPNSVSYHCMRSCSPLLIVILFWLQNSFEIWILKKHGEMGCQEGKRLRSNNLIRVFWGMVGRDSNMRRRWLEQWHPSSNDGESNWDKNSKKKKIRLEMTKYRYYIWPVQRKTSINREAKGNFSGCLAMAGLMWALKGFWFCVCLFLAYLFHEQLFPAHQRGVGKKEPMFSFELCKEKAQVLESCCR